MAGNAVVLKHSAQTPLCAERIRGMPARSRPARGRVPGAAPEPRGHGARDPRPARRFRRLHRLGRGRPCGAACGGGSLHRHRPRTRRLRSGLRPARRQPRARDREPRRRRVLQLRAILLRHPAHLRARAPVRPVRRGLGGPDAQVRARQPGRSRDHARPGRAHGRPPTRFVGRSPLRSPRARVPSSTRRRLRPAGPARPTSPRRCCSTSITRCR